MHAAPPCIFQRVVASNFLFSCDASMDDDGCALKIFNLDYNLRVLFSD